MRAAIRIGSLYSVEGRSLTFITQPTTVQRRKLANRGSWLTFEN